MVDVGGGLVAVIAEALGDELLGMRRVLAGLFLELVGVIIQDLAAVFDVRVDQFSIGDVDERAEVDDGCGDQSQTPDWEEFNQPVRDESCAEGLSLSDWMQE